MDFDGADKWSNNRISYVHWEWNKSSTWSQHPQNQSGYSWPIDKFSFKDTLHDYGYHHSSYAYPSISIMELYASSIYQDPHPSVLNHTHIHEG